MKPRLIDFDLFLIPDLDSTPHRCIGNGKKGILAIYESERPDPELESFLKKVLAAASIDLVQDVFLIQITPQIPLSFSFLAQKLDIRYLIAFGTQPQNMGLRFNYQPYLPIHVLDTTFLFADPLRSIYEERQAGGKKLSGLLWKAIQNIFLKKE